ncbi:MAG TPA: hypothetical protein VGB74_15745 [Actinoplanes sp.]|jgi:hypothetical protein
MVLLGAWVSLVGLSWDVQWHGDVGPDTFVTWPHLALYSGSALSGIASLVMVLRSTASQRAGRSFPRNAGGLPVSVFGGTFQAPLGYLISGVGAALFLLYGLLDLWWHTIYGFDATLSTPSHVALFLSISLTMIGSIVVFAAARDQRWARGGLLLAIGVFMVFGPIPFAGLDPLDLPINSTLIGVLLCTPTLLIMGAVLLGRWAAVRIAVVLGAMQAFLWWFSPWATIAYASFVGLPLRDGLRDNVPGIPNTIPMFLIVAALAVEGLLTLGRAGRLRPRVLVPLTGGVAGVLIGPSLIAQFVLVGESSFRNASILIPAAVAGLVLGLVAGYLGCRFAVLLRAAPSTALRTAEGEAA